MSSIRSLEHHEHAEHMLHAHGAGHGGEHGAGQEAAEEVAHAKADAAYAQWTALLVSFLAAGLAISEQGARHAEIKVQQAAIFAADAWGQYQGKSTRATIAKDLALLASTLDSGTDPAKVAAHNAFIAQLKADQDSLERDAKDGKDAVAHRARNFEEEREHVLEQTHAYHNGSASFELGIVLATASAITKSRPLLWLAGALGIAGLVLMALGYWKPDWGAL